MQDKEVNSGNHIVYSAISTLQVENLVLLKFSDNAKQCISNIKYNVARSTSELDIISVVYLSWNHVAATY